MERILSAEEMQKADKFTIEKLGVLEDTLIYRAGVAVGEEIKKRLLGGRVLVCIGKGNNGKDGKIIAEYLKAQHGFTVTTINVFNGIFKIFDKKFDIIVDCIFGTGLNRNVEGKYKTAIEKINNSGAYVVACDIASGLNSDTGLAMGIAVKANLTVAIQELKLGHFLNDGPDYSGTVIAKDIGISIWEDSVPYRINGEDISKLFKPRRRNVNKGNFGKVCIMGGSKNYTGSPLLSLSALSAFRAGAGYSTLAIPESLLSIYAGKYPECIVIPIKDKDGNFILDKEGLDLLLKNDCICFGMGAGISEENYKIVKYLLKNFKGNLIIDADGLNTLSKYGVDILMQKRKCKVVLTPHIKEFERLCGKDKEEILSDGINSAKTFAKEYNVILVLKSAVTIISDGTEVCINTTGNTGMAKAGNGDVLSGFTAGILSKSGDEFLRVCSACYLFGRAGEIAKEKLNEFSMTATDVSNELYSAINEIS